MVELCKSFKKSKKRQIICCYKIRDVIYHVNCFNIMLKEMPREMQQA